MLIGIVVGGGGICVGGAAALIAVFPSSALWTSANFQCVSAAGSYYANNLAIAGLQTLAIALVLGGIFLAVKMFRRP